MSEPVVITLLIVASIMASTMIIGLVVMGIHVMNLEGVTYTIDDGESDTEATEKP